MPAHIRRCSVQVFGRPIGSKGRLHFLTSIYLSNFLSDLGIGVLCTCTPALAFTHLVDLPLSLVAIGSAALDTGVGCYMRCNDEEYRGSRAEDILIVYLLCGISLAPLHVSQNFQQGYL
jgi:hypothetical protein